MSASSRDGHENCAMHGIAVALLSEDRERLATLQDCLPATRLGREVFSHLGFPISATDTIIRQLQESRAEVVIVEVPSQSAQRAIRAIDVRRLAVKPGYSHSSAPRVARDARPQRSTPRSPRAQEKVRDWSPDSDERGSLNCRLLRPSFLTLRVFDTAMSFALTACLDKMILCRSASRTCGPSSLGSSVSPEVIRKTNRENRDTRKRI